MINGAHAIIYSKDADADRAFFRDVLSLTSVDAGGGWLIFGLPPSEVAVHPTDGEGGTHELYLMCESVETFVTAMKKRGLDCADITDQGWGRLTGVTLAGGSTLGVYEPRHARPPVKPAKAVAKPATSAKAKPTAKAKLTAKAATKAQARPTAKAKAKSAAGAKAKPTAKAKASAKKKR